MRISFTLFLALFSCEINLTHLTVAIFFSPFNRKLRRKKIFLAFYIGIKSNGHQPSLPAPKCWLIYKFPQNIDEVNSCVYCNYKKYEGKYLWSVEISTHGGVDFQLVLLMCVICFFIFIPSYFSQN